MEKPGWVPVVLSGVLPRGVPDLFAMVIVLAASLNASLGSTVLAGLGIGPALLVLSVMASCALAASSNSARRLREELALFAYGSSTRMVGLRGFLRGVACVFLALLFYIALEARTLGLFSGSMIIICLAIVVGGVSYALPILFRTRSLDFVENYKG
ncbi:hypothetical protein AUG19_00700 [archaeon 13_1_20CM_2_54_9]|nr:MAG: hypothetical protein AUJ07_05380 [Crenarchaeota archaeon 13_1_40CM_3_53_5]OLE77263.1 MAG: hypothetical protein AUG19_00700 [archaeon 13_1_20CM_2_54_9]